MTKDSFENWEKFLNPEKLKRSLIQFSLYLAAYEVLRNCVIDRIKDFYTFEWHYDDTTGEIEEVVGEEYKTKVVSLYPRDEFHACCLWFQNSGAISQDDLEKIAHIRRHRNAIAHEIQKFLSSSKHSVDASLLLSLVEVVKKIEQWWFREVEVPTDPEAYNLDIDKIDWDGVMGGSTLSLTMMLSIFDGDDAYLSTLHQQIIEAWNAKHE